MPPAGAFPSSSDGAHAPGSLAVDIPALGVDYYSANLHKWAHAPAPAASCGRRADRQQNLRHPVVSWGSGKGFLREFEWHATGDPTAYLVRAGGDRAPGKDTELSRALDRHDIARIGDGAQREVQGIHAAARNYDVVGVADHAGRHRAAGYLPAERQMAADRRYRALCMGAVASTRLNARLSSRDWKNRRPEGGHAERHESLRSPV